MSSARFSGVIAIGVLFAPACFHPNYDHPLCGPNGECPSGLRCSPQGICEADGAKQLDASLPDANPICDPTGTFDIPVPLTGFITVSGEPPRLTADELELYFSASGGIYRAQRSTASESFGAPIALSSVNTTANEDGPSVSSDGIMLFFSSNRVSGQGYELYVSTRTSRVVEFDISTQVANVNSAAVTDLDVHPFMTADGQELWFASSRTGNLDIYRAVWTGSSFANATSVAALNSSASEYFPTLSADELTIYFSSNRPGGRGGFDIWTAHRSTISDGFSTPTLVSELNSNINEYAGWLSPDNCRLYLASDVVKDSNVYVAIRHPL